jgi:hypothetical protein
LLGFSELSSKKLIGVVLSLPLSNLILVGVNKVKEGRGKSCVGILPVSIVLLLQLKDLKAKIVDSIYCLILPFIIKSRLYLPRKYAEAIGQSLYMERVVGILIL